MGAIQRVLTHMEDNMKKRILLFAILVVMLLIIVATISPKANDNITPELTEEINLPFIANRGITEWIEVGTPTVKCVSGCDESTTTPEPIEYIEVEVIEVKCVKGCETPTPKPELKVEVDAEVEKVKCVSECEP
jgi:hypothetical protein